MRRCLQIRVSATYKNPLSRCESRWEDFFYAFPAAETFVRVQGRPHLYTQ